MLRNAEAFEAPDFEGLQKPGAYRFYGVGDRRDGIMFGCPCGCGSLFGMRFATPDAPSIGWAVLGQWPKVSATPSLACTRTEGEGIHWHGYLRNGVFEEC